jgi:hypothetical protein
MTLPLETRPAISTGRRPRRVMAGEGMVTPVEPLLLTENGKTEEFLPGGHRFVRDYPLVLKHPEWFEPCDPRDFDTYRRHRRLLEGTRRRLERELGTIRASTSTSPKRFQFSEGRRERFRLP